MSKDIEIRRPDFMDSARVLENNAFAIYFTADKPEDKIARLLALIPLSLEITQEARATIQRLNEENAELRDRLNQAPMVE